MIPETIAPEITHLPVITLKAPLSDAPRRTWVDRKLQSLSTLTTTPPLQTHLSKSAVGEGVGELDEGGDIKERGMVDEVEVGRDTGVKNTVLLITEA